MKTFRRYLQIFIAILLITSAYALITVPQGIIKGAPLPFYLM